MLYKNKYRVESARRPSWDYSNEGYYFLTIKIKDTNIFFGRIIDKMMYLSENGKITHQIWQQIPQHFPFAYLDEYVIMPDHIHGIIKMAGTNICGGNQINCDEFERDGGGMGGAGIVDAGIVDAGIGGTGIGGTGIGGTGIGGACRDAINRVSTDTDYRKITDTDYHQITDTDYHQITDTDYRQISDMSNNSDNTITNQPSNNHPKTDIGGITKTNNPMIKKNSIPYIIRWFKGRVTFEINNKSFPNVVGSDAINRVATKFKWQPRFHDHIIRSEPELNRIRQYIKNNPMNWNKNKNAHLP